MGRRWISLAIAIAIVLALGVTTIQAAGSPAATSASLYRITYDSFNSPKGLWIMNGDGTNQKPFHGGVFGSSWSADGKLVAFDTVSPLACALANQVGQVEVMNADGSNLRQLGMGCFPEISPDGKHVAYQAPAQDSHGNSINQIWVASTAGSGSVQILPGSCTANQCQQALFPAWAGNTELVFPASRQDSQDNSFHPALWTIASDGSQTDPTEVPGTEVSTSFVIGANGLTVDPQGKTILTTGGDSSGDHSDLYTLPLTGGTPTLLSAAPANHFYSFPQYSMDGRMIAFGDLEDTTPTQTNHMFIEHVDVMSASGGTPVQISGSDNTAFDPSFAPSGTLVVNSTGDAPDAHPGDGKCDTGKTLPDGTPECTFRAAIQEVNASTNISSITFNIPGTGVPTIVVKSTLPDMTRPITIDGSTQPGTASGQPGVLLSSGGNDVGGGLVITGGGATVRGLIVDTGLEVKDKGGNEIVGNYIGLDSAGTATTPSGGIRIDNASNNMIGTAGEGNVISGGTTGEIVIIDGVGNKVQGNLIGTNAAGTRPPGDCSEGTGVEIVGGKNNLIGGTTAADRNVIAGGADEGIDISSHSTGNRVEGNYIGTNASGQAFDVHNGTLQCDNDKGGVLITIGASHNVIGGTAAGAGNVISGNGYGFGEAGVIIGQAGFAETSDNVVQGNLIGTDATGKAPLGNAGWGVVIDSSTNDLVGGSQAGAENVIADNGAEPERHGGEPRGGVVVVGRGSGVGTQILGNSIFGNQGLGIDLGGDGVTPNHPNGSGVGPNGLQNYPVLTSATASGGSTKVVGKLNAKPNRAFLIEFFSNPACDDSHFGQGQTNLGPSPLKKVTTNAQGNAQIDVTLPVSVPAGEVVTSTATEIIPPGGQTSEFSRCVTVK